MKQKQNFNETFRYSFRDIQQFRTEDKEIYS